MGMIINIDEALKLRTEYNILREPLNDMMRNQQEAWEKSNPIDMLFHRGTIGTFQETYTSSIGFDHAFKETSDYAVGPIFNTAEGFAATYRTRTFQGGFIITQQTLEDRQMGKAKDDASAFVKRWHGDIVEYAMKAVQGGFAATTYNGSKLELKSADTTDGVVETETKNKLFGKHNTVKRAGGTSLLQYNMFVPSASINLSDSDVVPKIASLINGVITEMENYKDDNGKIAGVQGAKTIVAANDPMLKAVLNSAVETDMFKAGAGSMINPAYKRATVETTPYLNDIVSNFATTSKGPTKVPMFFIVDKAYNAENHGLELTERIPFTLDVFDHREAPKGVKYEGRQRFDINVATWRGIVAVFLTKGDVYCETTQIIDDDGTATAKVITVTGLSQPVTVVNTATNPVQTKANAQ